MYSFSFFVENISDSIIVSINKIGSLINEADFGSLFIGNFDKKGKSKRCSHWISDWFSFQPLPMDLLSQDLSWLWWNCFGFLVTFIFGYILSLFLPKENPNLDLLVFSKQSVEGFKFKKNRPNIILF